MGDYDEAHKLYTRALDDNEKNHDPDNPHKLATVNNLLRNEAEYDEALKLFQRVLSDRKKLIGLDYPDTIVTVGNLKS